MPFTRVESSDDEEAPARKGRLDDEALTRRAGADASLGADEGGGVDARGAGVDNRALVPALLLLVLLTKGVRILFLALFSRSVKRTDDVKSEAAATLQEMQRIALLARDDSEPLSDVALGALAVETFALSNLLRVHRARFKPARLRRLDRALRDLFAPLPARAVVAAE